MANKLSIPKKGERALIAGQTGMGKTALATFLLRRLHHSPIIIYDTKEEPKFRKLPNSMVVHSKKELREQIENGEIDYIIYIPPLAVASDYRAMDDLLTEHYYNYQGVDCYIDEAYSFHSPTGTYGPGLTAIMTRGRSKGITTIISTQRPVRISRFAITESQKFYIMRLVDKQDRARMSDAIPDFEDLPVPEPFWFYYYEAGQKEALLYRPIKLDSSEQNKYTDFEIVEEADSATIKLIWL